MGRVTCSVVATGESTSSPTLEMGFENRTSQKVVFLYLDELAPVHLSCLHTSYFRQDACFANQITAIFYQTKPNHIGQMYILPNHFGQTLFTSACSPVSLCGSAIRGAAVLHPALGCYWHFSMHDHSHSIMCQPIRG